jgi:hypothetical protein
VNIISERDAHKGGSERERLEIGGRGCWVVAVVVVSSCIQCSIVRGTGTE